MSNYQADVIIIGGGVGGCAAALAARARGARVLLIEKNPMFGGMATAARVHSMLTFHGGRGHRIIGGIPQKIINRLKSIGGTTGHIRDTVGVAWSVTPTDPDKLAHILQVMLTEAGVFCLLEARFLETVCEGNRVRSIRGVHSGGFFSAESPVFIDASGDGSLAASARAAFEQGRDGAVMPATLIFQVRNVDLSTVFDYIEAHPEEFHHETLYDRLRSSPAVGISGFFTLWKEANLGIPRDRLLFYQSLQPGEVGINSTRIIDFDPLNPISVREAYRTGRKQAFAIHHWLRESVPGFENCILSGIAPFLGVREVRRIIGKYVLTGKDLALGRRFPDEIAFGGFPIDIHVPTGAGIEADNLGGQGFYGIPYRTLLSENVENVLVVGKCFSAEFKAHASARVQATTMAMGQAAGAAAAMASRNEKSLTELPFEDIRQAIVDLGGLPEPGSIEDLP